MTRPFRLGLTGSIGMGKSTTAGFFAEQGVPIWDADAAVHRLYAPGGLAATALAQDFPAAVQNGAVNRAALKSCIAADPSDLSRLEALIHPLVAADRQHFLTAARAPLVVLDIPLLFETGLDADTDATLLVTAPPSLQLARVMARPGMTQSQFDLLVARQMPDAEKRKRAMHIVETLSLDATRAYVQSLLIYLRSTMTNGIHP